MPTPTPPPPTRRLAHRGPLLRMAGHHRPVRVGLALVVAVSAWACGSASGEDDPLIGLLERVPAQLAAEGILLQRGGGGSELLAASLGLDPSQVAATATTAAPAVRVLQLTAGADVTSIRQRLEDVGFEPPGGGADGIAPLLVRPPAASGFVGVPAVWLPDGVVVVGDVGQLQRMASGGAPLAIAAQVLEDAEVALVAGPEGVRGPGATGFAGDLPPFVSAVLTADPTGGEGSLGLLLADEGTQEDAVSLAVRLRTEGPLDSGGSPVLTAGDALTEGSAVVADVDWQTVPAPVLRTGLDQGLLTFLGS